MMSLFDLVDWLMAAETPSIRYQAARDLDKRPDGDPQVRSARQAIMISGPVPAIFAGQTATGQWANEHSYYTPKYVSTHWSLMLLAELHVDPDDARFQRGVDYMLEATAAEMRDLQAHSGHGLACFWGNVLYYALYAGRISDPRVQMMIAYTARDIRDGHCRCLHNDEHPCAWGMVRALWGLAALPPAQRDRDVQNAIDQALPFLLESFSLREANYPTPDNGKIHSMWSRLNFPLFYQADILFTLRVLAALDALDHPGAQDALAWVAEQRMANGRWRGASPYRQRTWHEMGDATETARWVSLQAALVLQQAGRWPDVSAA